MNCAYFDGIGFNLHLRDLATEKQPSCQNSCQSRSILSYSRITTGSCECLENSKSGMARDLPEGDARVGREMAWRAHTRGHPGSQPALLSGKSMAPLLLTKHWTEDTRLSKPASSKGHVRRLVFAMVSLFVVVGFSVVVVLHGFSKPHSSPSAASASIQGPPRHCLGAPVRRSAGDRRFGPLLASCGTSDPAIRRQTDGSLLMWFTTMGIRKGPDGGYAAGRTLDRASGGRGGFSHMTVDPDQPVVPMGAVGTWDRYVETPSVLPNDSGDGWTMWYLGFAERSARPAFCDRHWARWKPRTQTARAGNARPRRSTGRRRTPGTGRS